MAARFKIFLVVLLLTVAGGGLAAYKNLKFGIPLLAGTQPAEWLVEAKVSFLGEDSRVRVELSLPASAIDDGYGMEPASTGYNYHLANDLGEYTAVWTSEKKKDIQRLFYRIRFGDRHQSGGEALVDREGAPQVIEPGFPPAEAEAAQRIIDQVKSVSADPDSLFVGLFSNLAAIQSSQEIAFLRSKYETEVGRGALVMLGIDLLNSAGVPARLAYGVRLEEARGGQEALRLVEYWDGAYWKVRDPDDPGSTLDPRHYFVWHRGGGPLLEVTGGESSQVTFTVARNMIPLDRLTDLKGSPLLVSTIFGLPVADQAVFKFVVLIPLGAFVVVVMRNVVGIPTLGTFMPVLLALALLEMKIESGLIMFVVIITAGLWSRFLLSRLNLLVVPRVAACVVIVTLLMILMSVVSWRLGMEDGLQITLFPMIILAWTIERMSLIWEEEGKRSAILQVAGSVVVAVLAYSFMNLRQIRYWSFYFPELLLVLLAGIILLGRYTGYRLSELMRFRDFKEA